MEALERVCRICLQSEYNLEFTNIYSNNNEIALKLNLLGGIVVVEFTEYNNPALICPNCLKELYQCYQFRKKCQSADEYFKTKSAKIESQLWSLKDDNDASSDFNNIKLEPFENGNNAADLDLYSLDTKAEEIFNEQSVESRLLPLDDEFYDEGCVSKFEVKFEKPRSRGRPQKQTFSSTKAAPRKNSLQCRYCGIILSRRNRRIEHERLHFLDSHPKLYECAFCGKSFNQKFGKLHLMRNPDKSHNPRSLGLLPHFRKYHEFKTDSKKEKWKCAICVNKILPPGNMEIHYEKEHSSFCFDKTVSLTKAKPKPVKSSVRAEATAPKRSRTRKVKAPKAPVEFWPCAMCGNSFSNYKRYEKHLKETHEVSTTYLVHDANDPKKSMEYIEISPPEKPEKAPKFPCTTCGKAFASIMTVRAHEKTHLNIEYLCDLCGSSFRVKAYLTAHVQKVHMKLKKFKCSIENCSASFVHRELLNYHVRKHLNIRNFPCRYCGKTFMTRNCCKIHERIHTDERPYGCQFCDRTFIHHSDHRRHELKHTVTCFPTQ